MIPWVLAMFLVSLFAQPVSAQVFVTFAGTEYKDHFTDLLRGGDIFSQPACPHGPGVQPDDFPPHDCTTDLGPTGHVALNMIGDTPPLTWLTKFTPSGLPSVVGDGTVCVDGLIVRNGSDKGIGVAALLGGGTLGVAVVVTDQGYDDRLKLLTVNPVTGATVIKDQASYGNRRAPYNMLDNHGATDGQAFCGLYYSPNGPSFHNNCDWTRVCLTTLVNSNGSLVLDGSVTRHMPPDPSKPKHMWDPDMPLVSTGPMARVHFAGTLPGVGTAGSVGIIGVANGIYMTASVTNFSLDVPEPPPPPPPVCPPQ